MSAGACKGKTAFHSLSCRLSDWFLQKWTCQTCSSDNWKHNQTTWEAWKIWRVSMPLGCHLDSDHKALLLTPLRVLRIDLGSSPSDASHPTVHRMARLHLDVKLVCAFSPTLLLYQLESSREAEPIGWGQHWRVQVWTAEAHLYVDFFFNKNNKYVLSNCRIQYWLSLNKASGGDGIPVELFQIFKNDVVI